MGRPQVSEPQGTSMRHDVFTEAPGEQRLPSHSALAFHRGRLQVLNAEETGVGKDTTSPLSCLLGCERHLICNR